MRAAATHRRKHREFIILLQHRIRRGVFLVHSEQQRTAEAFKLRKASDELTEGARDGCGRSQCQVEHVCLNHVACSAKEKDANIDAFLEPLFPLHSISIFLLL